MSFFDVVNLFGGLALFLYGMNEMGNALENMSGSKMEKILTKLTSNPLKSVAFGALITAAIQSSSATTVIVVGLVNSKILKLSQAVGVIMGANIGTTITAQMLSLSGIESTNFFVQLLKPKSFAPMFAIIGIILVMTAKKKKQKNIGTILVGLGVLFTGMFAMEAAVEPLKDSPFFADLFVSLKNPILGVLAGTFVTALLQSSSASIGILQALTVTGVISVSAAFPIIMGQNIGTCITPIISSIGASRNAKRTAAVHLYFNIIGTAVFLIAIYAFQHFVGFSFWNDTIDKGGIANFHTIFNLSITLLFLPFTKQLCNLAEKTIKDNATGEDEDSDIPILEERFLTTPSIAIPQVKHSIDALGKLSRKNFSKSIDMIGKFKPKIMARLLERENTVNKLEVNLSHYLVKLTDKELTEDEGKTVTHMLQNVIEFENISDYAVKIAYKISEIQEENVVFSDASQKELSVMSEALHEIVDTVTTAFVEGDVQSAKCIEPLEETIDLLNETIKYNHLVRLKNGNCSIDSGILFLELISIMESVSDCCANIAFSIIAHDKPYDGFDRHKYKRNLHEGKKEFFNEKFIEYQQKYCDQIR